MKRNMFIFFPVAVALACMTIANADESVSFGIETFGGTNSVWREYARISDTNVVRAVARLLDAGEPTTNSLARISGTLCDIRFTDETGKTARRARVFLDGSLVASGDCENGFSPVFRYNPPLAGFVYGLLVQYGFDDIRAMREETGRLHPDTTLENLIFSGAGKTVRVADDFPTNAIPDDAAFPVSESPPKTPRMVVSFAHGDLGKEFLRIADENLASALYALVELGHPVDAGLACMCESLATVELLDNDGRFFRMATIEGGFCYVRYVDFSATENDALTNETHYRLNPAWVGLVYGLCAQYVPHETQRFSRFPEFLETHLFCDVDEIFHDWKEYKEKEEAGLLPEVPVAGDPFAP